MSYNYYTYKNKKATLKQKKLILSINKSLGIPFSISKEIVNNICENMYMASEYIKKWLPHSKIKNLDLNDIIKIYKFMQKSSYMLLKNKNEIEIK